MCTKTVLLSYLTRVPIFQWRHSLTLVCEHVGEAADHGPGAWPGQLPGRPRLGQVPWRGGRVVRPLTHHVVLVEDDIGVLLHQVVGLEVRGGWARGWIMEV